MQKCIFTSTCSPCRLLLCQQVCLWHLPLSLPSLVEVLQGCVGEPRPSPWGSSPASHRQLFGSWCFYLIQLPHPATHSVQICPFFSKFLLLLCSARVAPSQSVCGLSYPCERLLKLTSDLVFYFLHWLPMLGEEGRQTGVFKTLHDLTVNLTLEPDFSHKWSFLNYLLKGVCCFNFVYLLLLLRFPFNIPSCLWTPFAAQRWLLC